ncbi:MAG: hypothetical protein OXG47_08525, partial [bacterium]|nr:hypothetical protein [bacterium]
DGRFAAGATGKQTVTIPTTGTATYTVATEDDEVYEADGAIRVYVSNGPGYTISADAAEASVAVTSDDDPEGSVVSVTAGADVTEGGSASFTVTADPAPEEALTVTVTITQTGDFAAAGATGERTVTIPTTGSATHTVATTDDEADEEDGSVTLTVEAGEDYEVSTVHQAASVVVADDDDAAEPEISVTAGPDVTEGEDASFTVTADPAPEEALTVTVTITQTGDFAGSGTTGEQTVTIPTTGSVTHTVATTGDEQDEADGSISVTLNAGSGYTVSADAGAASVAVADDDPASDDDPVISVRAGSGISEGGTATFTLTADPAPSAPLQVSVQLIQSGDFGAAGGAASVTIPTTGSVAHAVATTDDGADERDGSVTLSLTAGQGYAVSSANPAATVVVRDNDAAPAPTPQTCATSDASLLARVLAKTQDPWQGARPDLVETFSRAYNTMLGTDTYTVAALKARADRQTANWQGAGPNPLWQQIYLELDRLETCRAQAGTPPPPEATPAVSVTAGAGVTEGGSARFTITASPAPASALRVVLTVTQQGDYGATVGAQIVTIPTAGSVSLAVATAGDAEAEADGSVTLTLNPGSGYTVAAAGAATVAVADDDDPQQDPPTPPPPAPEVSVTAGAGVVEGSAARFTITAGPAPSTLLTVKLVLTQQGDYGVSTGTKTVAIPTSGTKSYAVATAGDHVDEADGSVTLTLLAGPGYTVAAAGAATVAIADDDDPPLTPTPRPEISVTAGAGVSEGTAARFTITADPAPSAALSVTLAVTQTGDYGVSTGTRTVVIPTSGTKSVTVTTANDAADEADGSVTVTLQAGSGYTVSSARAAATVAVSDDDVPALSVRAGAGVSEGTAASFTITAHPAPAAALTVTLTVTQTGDYGVSTGTRTVVIPTSGTKSVTVATVGDSTDEADGSVTLTLQAGSGYSVASQGAATVTVSDDDDPPPAANLPTVSIEPASASEREDELVFRVTLSEAASEAVRVGWYTYSNNDRDQRPARAGLDYEYWSGTITIAAGQTSGSGRIWLLDDQLREGPEVFDVWLTPNLRGAEIAVQRATMTIIDDD